MVPSISRWLPLLCAALLVALAAAADADVSYKVRKGDSLARIAKRFHVTPDALRAANGLQSDRIMPGMRLAVPGAPARPAPPRTAGKSPRTADETAARETGLHTVEKGETLASIAEMHGMSVRELKKINRVRRPRRLKPGMQLVVRKAPIGVPAESPPQTTGRGTRLARETHETAGTPEPPEVPESPGDTGRGVAGTVASIKEQLVRIAQEMIDIPYRFGGRSLLGIDCSGYVQRVFSLLNIALPRTAREQFNLGTFIGKEHLTIGDLVFFRTYAKYPSHVGIYVGDNLFIHASSRDRKVKVDSLGAPYYLKRFIGGRRLDIEDPGPGQGI